jgi:hypothetical protein
MEDHGTAATWMRSTIGAAITPTKTSQMRRQAASDGRTVHQNQPTTSSA